MTVQEIQLGLYFLVIWAVAVLFSIISLMVKRGRKQTLDQAVGIHPRDATPRSDPEVWPPEVWPPNPNPESNGRHESGGFSWLKRKG